MGKKVNKVKLLRKIYADVELKSADGFDSACIGIDERSMRLIYSVRKCIKILMVDMDYDQAIEYFEFNISGAWVGDNTPIWCEDDQ